MAKEKERFEILLEEVRDNVKLVAEGHSTIRREMQEMKTELKADIKEVNNKLEFVARELGGKIDKVDRTLEEHVKLPAHAFT
jgi:hypothetical protein